MTRAFGKRQGRREMTTPTDKNDDVKDTKFFNVFDGTKGRSPGIYLDMQERIEAEKSRAILEGREPDLSNPGALPAATSTPLVPKERQVDNSVYSNPSIAFTGEKDVDPVATLPVDFGTADADVDLSLAAQYARERKAQDEALADEPSDAQPTDTTTGEVASDTSASNNILVSDTSTTNDTTY